MSIPTTKIPPSTADKARAVAVIDIGTSSIRMAIAEIGQLLEKLIKQVDIKPDQMPGAKKK